MLIKGADLLVEGASSAAKKFKVKELIIGLTIVAFGTSAPEMVVNIISSYDGHDEVVFGNIIGSNIFNLFLILGVAGVIYPMSVRNNTFWKEIPYSFVITIVLFILVNDVLILQADTNGLSRWDGFILLGMFGLFMFYIFKSLKNDNEDPFVEEAQHLQELKNSTTIFYVLFGIVGLGFGGKLVVDNAVSVAEHYDVSQKLIGLTIISIGTSLPELATSIVAAMRKKSDIALGNVLGSNIFNITLILGISVFVKPLTYNPQLNIDFIVLFGGTALLFFFMFTLHTKKLDRWEAVIYVMCFVAYLIFLFIRK